MTQLELDVDFDYKKGMVGLRFFERDEDGDRYPLRVQRLYNMMVQARRDPSVLDPDMRNFLLKLASEVSKPAVLSANLQILQIPRSTWDHLKTHAIVKKTGARDHASGAAMSLEDTPVSLYFELESHGDSVLFSAVLDGPSGPLPWSAVCDGVRQRRLSGRKPQTVVEAPVDGVLRTLDLPVDVDLLNQLFRKDNQRIKSGAISSALPVLIDQRLDRLRGPSVDRRNETAMPQLSLTSDGAFIVASASINGVGLRFDRDHGTFGLERNGDRFIVVDYECRHFSRLKRFFNELDATPCPEGYRVQGSSEAVTRLTTLLEALPSDLPIEMDGDLKHLTGAPVAIETGFNVHDHGGWFAFEVQCRIGDKTVELADLRRAQVSSAGVIRTRDGFWLKLDPHELGALDEIADLVDDKGRGSNVRTELESTLNRMQQIPTASFSAPAERLADTVRRESEAGPVPIDDILGARLRTYQREGVQFLCSRVAHGVGPLLADDMGLGKTVQTLTALVAMKAHGVFERSILVVCPASVVYVWEREAATFFPDLNVELLIGSPAERKCILNARAFDLAICSYAVLRNDLDAINDASFSVAVLDEAQVIRNPAAQVTQAAWGLQVDRRIALTGTPLENRLTDIWSIMTFLNPGYLGTEAEFDMTYGRQGNRQLTEALRPILLRRKKGDVAKDLPDRTEEVIKVPFEPDQADVYASQLAAARKKSGGTMQLLAALTRLRQVCCHPRLVSDDFSGTAAKMILLKELVEELVDEGHSILIFSQFTSMLDIIRDELERWEVAHLMLTGETSGPKRRQLVEEFNESDEPEVFLLSLKAAGTGLTLTKADYVIIFDPWWNPAAENQAIDRTHRIGQVRPVIAYRFIMAGSVEEKVLDLQAEKRILFESVVDGVEASETSLNAEELASLLI